MKHYLITTEPIKIQTSPALNSLPSLLNRPDEMTKEQVNEGMPDGYKYVPDLPRPPFDPATQRLERTPITENGWGWDIVDLTPEEIAERNPVPASVTRRQLLLALASLPTPITQEMIEAQAGGNELALIEIRNAGTFERNHPLIDDLAAALQMSDESVDELFRAASQYH